MKQKFKKVLNVFSTYRFWKKYDYRPIDKLRMFLDESWVIEDEPFMSGVFKIYNKKSFVNTKIIKNSLLFTDMDYVTSLCKNLILRHERNMMLRNNTQALLSEESLNKDLTATQQVATPKCPSDTSSNPDIIRRNSDTPLTSEVQQ